MWEYWESLPLSSGWKPSFEAALGTGQHMPVHSVGATRFQPDALLYMPLSGSPHHGGMILCGFQREAEMEWKCLAIHFCALWGFSEEYTGCSLQSTPVYTLTLRKTRHERYSCHEHRVTFTPSPPSQLDCWRPDGNVRYTAVNHEPFTSLTVQSEQDQAFPPKTQYCWRGSWGLPFVCN